MSPNVTIPRLTIAVLAIAAASLLAPAAFAGTITVDDNGDTIETTTCTLRAAMQSAFQESDAGGCTGTTASPNTITFSGDFTITILSTDMPNIRNDVAVDGSGHAVVIDGDGANRPFRVTSGGHLTLLSLTL